MMDLESTTMRRKSSVNASAIDCCTSATLLDRSASRLSHRRTRDTDSDDASTIVQPCPQGGGWQIALRITVPGTTRRVFNALVEPEYRELWMRFPGQDACGEIRASQCDESFRLDHYQSRRLVCTVSGIYRVCRVRKIAIDWVRQSPSGDAGSLVDLRVVGSFHSSIIRLNHRGIGCEADCLWHLQMWEISLKALAGLLGP